MAQLYIKKLKPRTVIGGDYLAIVGVTHILVYSTANISFVRKYPGNYLDKTVMFLDKSEDTLVDTFRFLGITHDSEEFNLYFKYGFVVEKFFKRAEDFLNLKATDTGIDTQLIFWKDNNSRLRSSLYRYGLHFTRFGEILNSPLNKVEEAPTNPSQILAIFDFINYNWFMKTNNKEEAQFILNSFPSYRK